MLSDEEILKRAHDGIQENLLVTAWWRSNEIRDNYGLYEGSQWLEEESSRQIANNQPIRTMNRVQPVVDAITGFEIQNRSTAKFIPRVPEQMEQGVSDLVNDGIKWLEQTGDYGMMKSLAVSDMLICGMGFLEHKIEYTENPNGKDKQERVFHISCYGCNYTRQELCGC